MQATKQQQIIGYFIEEAKEHLDTIEQGLLNLQATMADSERLNEMFRAAHSVKGGAAMLGFAGVQKVSHHLEDCFKLLTENSVKVDRHLEDLFLKASDILKDLVEEIQSPYAAQGQPSAALQTAEPLLAELESYLNRLINGNQVAVNPNLPALTNAALKKMLQLFKQGDSPTTRQQLKVLCDRMLQMHTCQEWQTILQTTQRAVANTSYPYQTIAAVIIRDLKQAGDLLCAGRSAEITASKNLQQLAGVPKPAPVAPPVAKPTVNPTPAIGNRQQISIPLEPRAAARVLLENFDKQQLIEMADFIMKAIQ